MAVHRKKVYVCHFCHRPIDEALIKQRSISRECSSWLIVRGGVKRKYLGTKLGARMAHNACVEAAFTPGLTVGQEELWPSH